MALDIAADSALLVIDMQQGFADPFWGRRDNPLAEENAARIIDGWRASRRPIVMVTHASRDPRSPLHPDSAGHRLIDDLAGIEPALRITKSVNSAFYGAPDLHEWLGRAGIQQVVVIGIQTNMCNETTARMAGNLGYDVLFVIDAMHTFDVEGPDGSIVTAEELTRATAASLHGGGFARVVRTDDVLDAVA
ncbi:MAG: cysteine hydrolase family protein [Naasia sp.]